MFLKFQDTELWQLSAFLNKTFCIHFGSMYTKIDMRLIWHLLNVDTQIHEAFCIFVTIVNNDVVDTWNLEKIDCKLIFSPHILAHSGNYVEMMGMLISLIIVLLLQCICNTYVYYRYIYQNIILYTTKIYSFYMWKSC